MAVSRSSSVQPTSAQRPHRHGSKPHHARKAPQHDRRVTGGERPASHVDRLNGALAGLPSAHEVAVADRKGEQWLGRKLTTPDLRKAVSAWKQARKSDPTLKFGKFLNHYMGASPEALHLDGMIDRAYQQTEGRSAGKKELTNWKRAIQWEKGQHWSQAKIMGNMTTDIKQWWNAHAPKPVPKPSASPAAPLGNYMGDFLATAYAPFAGGINGSGSGITASGRMANPIDDAGNGTPVSVAVDPQQIPLGTIFHLKQFPGVTFRADDTGGAIGWGRMDIAFGSEQEALNFNHGAGSEDVQAYG